MAIYIKRVEEFDGRRYNPSDPDFDSQEFIDWILSFEEIGGCWPSNAAQNSDGSLSIEITDGAGGGWTETLTEGMIAFVRVVPDTGWNQMQFKTEEDFNQTYKIK